jgi:hypothetical protein
VVIHEDAAHHHDQDASQGDEAGIQEKNGRGDVERFEKPKGMVNVYETKREHRRKEYQTDNVVLFCQIIRSFLRHGVVDDTSEINPAKVADLFS